jgi:SCP-2 sterol transfer family
MTDATRDFFRQLEEHGPHPALQRTSGTIGIDLDRDGRTDHWRLDVRRGAVALSRGSAPADCVIKGSGQVFDEVVSGRANALASMLRGELAYEGDPGLLVRFQRLFPSPTGRHIAKSSRTVGRRRG